MHVSQISVLPWSLETPILCGYGALQVRAVKAHYGLHPRSWTVEVNIPRRRTFSHLGVLLLRCVVDNPLETSILDHRSFRRLSLELLHLATNQLPRLYWRSQPVNAHHARPTPLLRTVFGPSYNNVGTRALVSAPALCGLHVTCEFRPCHTVPSSSVYSSRSRGVPAWKCLIDNPGLISNERTSLVADIFLDRSEIEGVMHLSRGDAQSFVDAIAEVLSPFHFEKVDPLIRSQTFLLW